MSAVTPEGDAAKKLQLKLIEAAVKAMPGEANLLNTYGLVLYRNARYQYNPCSPVIYFGRGESCQRGYQFNHPR